MDHLVTWTSLTEPFRYSIFSVFIYDFQHLKVFFRFSNFINKLNKHSARIWQIPTLLLLEGTPISTLSATLIHCWRSTLPASIHMEDAFPSQSVNMRPERNCPNLFYISIVSTASLPGSQCFSWITLPNT